MNRRLRDGLASFGLMLGALTSAACGPSDGSPPAPHASGRVTTLVGTGRQGFDGDGHAAQSSWLNQPTELSVGPDGLLYLIDWNNHRIRRQRDDGSLETLLGRELPGDWPLDSELGATLNASELHLNHPLDLAFTAETMIVAAWHNHKLLDFSAGTASARVIAGGNRPGYAEDGVAPSAALLNFPASIVLDAEGAIVFSDQRNNIVRRVVIDANDSSKSTLETVLGVKGVASYAGDSGPARSAGLGLCPYDEAGGADNPPPGGGLALAEDGTLYLADTYNHCVRRVAPGADGVLGSGDPADELIETFAGRCGEPGFLSDASSPESLRLRNPNDLELHDGKLYIADTGNHVVWSVALEDGRVERVVGTGTAGEVADGSAALETPLSHPYGIGFDAASNLLIADTLNNKVRIVWK